MTPCIRFAVRLGRSSLTANLHVSAPPIGRCPPPQLNKKQLSSPSTANYAQNVTTSWGWWKAMRRACTARSVRKAHAILPRGGSCENGRPMCPGLLQRIRAMADVRRGSGKGARVSTKTSVCIAFTPFCAMYCEGLRKACAILGAFLGREAHSAVG